MKLLSLILKRRVLDGACLSLLAVAIATPLEAANLLDGQPVLVSRSKTSETPEWVAEIPFTEAKRQDLRLKVEFDLKTIPQGRILSLKKPRDISDWTLNGQHLIQPPKDMFYPELEGIPMSALKVGKNILEAEFSVNVHVQDGKIIPASSGQLKLDLQPQDVAKFDIRTGPILGAAGTDYFTVGCRTRMPAIVTLRCDGRVWTSQPGVIHLLRADGLTANKKYEYQLTAELVGGGATATTDKWQVKTMPANGPVNFVAIGDARYNPKIWGLITNQILKLEPAFAVHTGDIVGNGNDYDIWDRDYATPAKKFLATVPCFYTFGNHENNVSMIYQIFGFPKLDQSDYEATIGPVQLFAMNRFKNWGKNSGNLVQMEKQLAASKSPFIFAFTHPPAWSSASHGNDKLGNEIHFPIFNKYHVTASIAGHDHCYERSEPGGTTMLIAGGGGASLYKQEQLKNNPHSKVFLSEYNIMIFRADDKQCELKAYVCGDMKTADNERKFKLADTRVWEARAESQGAAGR